MEAKRSSLATFLGGAAVFVGAAGVIGFLVPAFYAERVNELKAERGWTSTPVETVQTKSAQASRLKSYAWIDRSKGVVAVPIERAMELVIAEHGGSSGEARK